MSERWRPFKGTCYLISDQGRVARLLEMRPTWHGYKRFSVCKGYKKKDWQTHQVVARVWLGAVPKGKQVNHKNGDKLDNRAANLEYVTRSENAHHAIRIGLRKVKLTPRLVRVIRKSELPKRKLAALLGISRRTIEDVKARRTWAHVQQNRKPNGEPK